MTPVITANRLFSATSPLVCTVLTQVILASTVGAEPVPPMQIGDHRQLLFDQTFLSESKGIELVVHPPRKTGEVTIACDRAWEKGGIGPYSGVLKVGDVCHMWYHTCLLYTSAGVSMA